MTISLFPEISVEGNRIRPFFEYMMEKAGITPDEGIMVGDNLNTDILGSSRVGMRNVWINRENKPRNPEIVPTYEVKSLTEFLELLEKIS